MRARLLTVWVVALLLTLDQVNAQCPAPGCPSGSCAPAIAPKAPLDDERSLDGLGIDRRAIVRVVNERGAERSLGSGTLIDTADKRAWVLTCGHLFREGAGRVLVLLTDGRACEARLLQCDQRADLALLEIASPSIASLEVAAAAPSPGEPVISCGYGSDGRLGCNRGQVLGYVTLVGGHGRETLELSGRARSGDSGGPVIDGQGRLAAVLFGTNGRVVDATYCGRVRKFLQGLTPRFGGASSQPPLVTVPPRAPTPTQPPTAAPPIAPSNPPRTIAPRAPRVELPPAAPAQDRPWEDRVGGAVAQAAEPWITAKLTAVLIGLGLPTGLAALAGGAAAWLVLRRGRKQLQARLGRLRERVTATGDSQSPETDELDSPPTALSVERHHNRYVPYADRALDKAWAAAHARVGEKYPGAIPYLKIVEGVKDQLVSGVEPADID